MEERLVPKAGYPLHLVDIGSFNGASFAKKLKTLVQIPFSFFQALHWLLRFRPQIVLGVGGYASFPTVLAASCVGWAWGARVAILEQNVLPGLSNRILGWFSKRVFAAFPGSEAVFGQKKVMITGNPIRSTMTKLPAASSNPFTVFIFGGSQGAMGINSLVLDALQHLKGSSPQIRWIHQTGEKDYERVRAAHEVAGSGARVEKFIYEMPEAYRQASLLICRAGSSTLAEVAAVGRASILIPLVSKDRHQEHNAQLFAQAGAAEMILQKSTDGAALAQRIQALAGDPERLKKMENAVTQFARPDAVDRIVSALGEKF
jgi:UDP-N-acetylglucosamine--N-acetylmuramyl-(pentapeptide) pyrophosphoryl-undecaprenol N-acetylglucosamine transferase